MTQVGTLLPEAHGSAMTMAPWGPLVRQGECTGPTSLMALGIWLLVGGHPERLDRCRPPPGLGTGFLGEIRLQRSESAGVAAL